MTVTHKSVYNLSDNISYLSKIGFRYISSVIDQYDKEWDVNSINGLKIVKNVVG